MTEIKLRNNVANTFAGNASSAIYRATTIEMIYFQFRKILELIALGSFVANKDLFSKAYKNFSKHWNARLLIKHIERINPDFYPRPIIQKQISVSESGPKQFEWLDRPDDYLTKAELLKLYVDCNNIMHAKNPYDSQVDYAMYEKKLSYWGSRIVNLLNAHYIRLVNDPNLYLIQIQMASLDTKPNYTIFAPYKI